MPIFKPFTTKIILAIGAAVILAHIAALGYGYYQLYSESDGFKLSNGQPVGGDFVTFYQAGKMFKEESNLIYNFDYYLLRQQELYNFHGMQQGKLVFIYPPLMAGVFSLISQGNLLHSYLIWAVISIILFFGSLFLLIRENNVSWKTYFLSAFLALGYYTFSLWTLGAGQTSCIAVFILAMFYILLRRNKPVWAGLILALAYYKPPIFLGLVLVLLFAKQWRVIYGFFIGSVCLVAFSIYSVGIKTFIFYLEQASKYRYGQDLIDSKSLPVDKGVGFLAALESLNFLDSSANQIILLSLSIVIAFLLARTFKEYFTSEKLKSHDFMLTYSAMVSYSLLFSPQMVNYDLSILFPFFLCSLLVLMRNFQPSLNFSCLIGSCILLYFEEYFRNINFYGVNIKGTTVLWIIASVALYRLAANSYKNRPDFETT